MRLNSKQAGVIIASGISLAIIAALVFVGLYNDTTKQNLLLPNNSNQQSTGQLSHRNDSIESSTGTNFNSINSRYAKEFALPRDTLPNGIVVDHNGTVWTVGSKSHNLMSISSEGIKSYPIPVGGNQSNGLGLVWSMIEDKKDGSILFSGSDKNPVWRFHQSTHEFQSIGQLSTIPVKMKQDDYGNVWYTL